MPWRPTHWWRGYKNLARRDPTALVAAFALYAALSGCSLVLPGDSFDVNPIYNVARELGVPEEPTGWAMFVDAFLLFVCLGWRCTPSFRAMVSVGTGAAWFFWGGLLALGGIRVGFFAPAAAWTMICALLVMQATAGWAYPGVQPLLEDKEETDPWN